MMTVDSDLLFWVTMYCMLYAHIAAIHPVCSHTHAAKCCNWSRNETNANHENVLL